MRRPLGVTTTAIYLCFIAAVTVGEARLDFRLQRAHGLVWAELIFGLGLSLTAWGLFRLWEWARFTAMLIIFVAVGARIPLFLLRTKQFDVSFFLILCEELFDSFVVWYLFRSATAKHFSRVIKTAQFSCWHEL